MPLNHLCAKLVETERGEVTHLDEVFTNLVEPSAYGIEAGIDRIKPSVHGIEPSIHRLGQPSNAHRHDFLEVLRHIDDDRIVRSQEQARRSCLVQAWVVNDTGQFVQAIPDSAGALISFDECELVEFFLALPDTNEVNRNAEQR